MEKYRVIAIGFIITLITGISYAGGPDLAPSSGKFIVGGEYGLFKQSNVGTQYGILSDGGVTPQNPAGQAITIPTEYRSGWGLHAGYLFANDNDLLLSGFTYYGTDNGSIFAGPSQTIFMSLGPAALANVARSAFSVYSYKTELYNLSFGHRFHLLNKALMLHPSLGIGLGKSRESQNTLYGAIGNVNGVNTLVSNVSSFNGAGPDIGLDLSLRIWNWFSLIGNAEWLGVIAKLKQDTLASATGNSSAFDVPATSNPNIINILSFKLGLLTDFQIKDRDIGLTIGYRAVDIINGSANFIVAQGVNTSGDYIINNFRDISFQGPFIEVSATI